MKSKTTWCMLVLTLAMGAFSAACSDDDAPGTNPTPVEAGPDSTAPGDDGGPSSKEFAQYCKELIMSKTTETGLPEDPFAVELVDTLDNALVSDPKNPLNGADNFFQ